MYGYDWKPYVPVAQRRREAAREVERLAKKGQPASPVVLKGKTIATTFWGKAWCENLERYSDYENRLPRGRAYVRNGSVVDLQVGAGEVKARVSGSKLYKTVVKVAPLPKARWKALCAECSGGIDSLVELLQGRFSKGVMERICQQKTGLFPSPAEIELDCSCPDWAEMCKHVAAVLYGIGARLDEKPELLFTLRQVDPAELLARAAEQVPLAANAPADGRVLESDDLGSLFGIDLAAAEAPPEAPKRAKATKAKATTAKTAKATATRAAVEVVAKPARRAAGRPKAKARARPAGKRAAAKKPAAEPKRTARRAR